MFDIGWSELILIGVVALIVIGPKDLPDMFRQLGRFTAKMRSMARDFSRAMEQAANESGVKDVARDLKSVTSPQSLGLNAVRDAAAKFERWDPLKPSAAPATGASTTAAAAVTPPAVSIVGPETQALLDQQAARQAIIKDSTERLRALKPVAPQAMPATAEPPATPSAKPKSRAKTGRPAEVAPLAVAEEKPKAKRKPKKADEA